jgi:hypothetical protein
MKVKGIRFFNKLFNIYKKILLKKNNFNNYLKILLIIENKFLRSFKK